MKTFFIEKATNFYNLASKSLFILIVYLSLCLNFPPVMYAMPIHRPGEVRVKDFIPIKESDKVNKYNESLDLVELAIQMGQSMGLGSVTAAGAAGVASTTPIPQVSLLAKAAMALGTGTTMGYFGAKAKDALEKKQEKANKISRQGSLGQLSTVQVDKQLNESDLSSDTKARVRNEIYCNIANPNFSKELSSIRRKEGLGPKRSKEEKPNPLCYGSEEEEVRKKRRIRFWP